MVKIPVDDFILYGEAKKPVSVMTAEEFLEAGLKITEEVRKKSVALRVPVIFGENGKTYELHPDGSKFLIELVGPAFERKKTLIEKCPVP